MEYTIYRDKKKVVEVLEWIEVNGRMYPKHKKTTYFNPKDRPDFGQKQMAEPSKKETKIDEVYNLLKGLNYYTAKTTIEHVLKRIKYDSIVN